MTKQEFWKLTGTSFSLGCIHVYEDTEITCKVCPYKNPNGLCTMWTKEEKQNKYKKFMQEQLNKLFGE